MPEVPLSNASQELHLRESKEATGEWVSFRQNIWRECWVDGLSPLLGAVFKKDPFHDIMFHFALEQGHRKRARSEELRQGLFNRLPEPARSEELCQV